MALDSVATVVKTVIKILSSPVQKELGLLLGYGKELEMLSSSLTAINASLKDAEDQQFSSTAIKDWLQKLKDAAYKLDDILEECAYHDVESEHEGLNCRLLDMVCISFLSSFHPKHACFRWKTARKMKEIMEKLDQIADERKKYHLTQSVPQERSTAVLPWRETFAGISETQVYGREEDKEKIVNSLVCDASEDLTVYPIVGQGGLGKTTLAKLIFNHERVEDFEPKIWVCVSEDFSPKRMLKEILAACGQESGDTNLEALRKKVKDVLQNKKYLLVLDDVWDDGQDNWETLKSVLAGGAKGASVLVTTRLSQVATVMGTVPPHQLSKLSDDDCLEVFKQRAFGSKEKEREGLLDIGKEIVKKCGGVPLAAKSLGSLLRFKRLKEDWLFVRDSKLWNLPQQENSVLVMPALRLSYLKLPMELRQCFSFCALFSKDERINKQFLVSIWMANGFISSNETSDAEVIGENVVNELCWRSFFEDVETDKFGKITSFKLHDLIHDLAESVAEEVCCITDDKGVTAVTKRIRHLSTHSNKSFLDVKYLKTYLMQDYVAVVPPDVLKCYSLRMLKIRGLQDLPSEVGRLKYLSYLDISSSRFETLPESLCELLNLEILILDDCRRLKRFPNKLICLKSLQCLSLSGCFSLSSMPPQIGKLTSLKNLSMYIVGKEEGFLLAELGQLNLQGMLEIEHLERVKSVRDAEEAKMCNKHLNELWFSWNEDEECELQENVEEILQALQPHSQQLQILGVEGYPGGFFPQWMSSPSLSNLHSLRLWYCESCLNLSGMGILPSLKNLTIHGMYELQYLDNESREGGANMFPCLYKLEIEDCPELLDLPCLPSLKYLSISGEYKQELLSGFHKLPNLEFLLLGENRELTCIPDGMLRNLNSLKTLRILSFEKLESLTDEVFRGLHSLKTLQIKGCNKVNLLTSFRYLTCLEHLQIEKCDAVTNLQLHDMTSLESLSLHELRNLESLPDCFGNLLLLQQFIIYDCGKLRYLPTSFQCLRSLETLSIVRCPELQKRCEKETGEDWPKIAHIPSIY